jgi:hypothetical protein
LLYHQDPSVGLFGTGFKYAAEVVKDIGKVSEDGITEENAGKIVRDVVRGIAVTKGWANEEEASFLKGIIDVYNEQQQPETLTDVVRLVTKGDISKHGPLDWLTRGILRSEATETKGE